MFPLLDYLMSAKDNCDYGWWIQYKVQDLVSGRSRLFRPAGDRF